MRVLLATASPVLRDALNLFLAEHGVEIVPADAAPLSLRAAAGVVDVVLVDWHSDDPAAAADLRAAIADLKQSEVATPIVSLSTSHDRADARAAGVDACATLGDPPPALVAVLRQAIALRAAGDRA